MYLNVRRLYNWAVVRREQSKLSELIGDYMEINLEQALSTHTRSCTHDMSIIDQPTQLVVYTCLPQGKAIAELLKR